MRRFGLIGRSLSHSFSKAYFEEKFGRHGIDAEYENYELGRIEGFPELLRNHKFSGLNVTIPYKTAIIPFLDELDPLARSIGAVNTVKFLENHKTRGYNTDYFGFKTALEEFLNGRTIGYALVLGSGGASLAVRKVLHDMDIAFEIVSRQGKLSYDNLPKPLVKKSRLIINCTPLGTHPDTSSRPPIPYEILGPEHYLFDLVYNPPETAFLKKGKENLCKTQNGLAMLRYQAEKAWEIWND